MGDSHTQPGTELLPCPFCGSPARTDLLPHEWGPGWVQCSACECTQFMSNTIGEAVARWNTRATPAQPAGMRDKIARIIDPDAKFRDIVGVHWSRVEIQRRQLAYQKADIILALPAGRPAVAQPVKPFDLNDPRPIWEQGRGNAQAAGISLPGSLVRSLRDHLQQSDSFLWLDEIQTLDAALASFEKIRGILARVCTCGVASYLSVHDAGCPLSSTVREGGE